MHAVEAPADVGRELLRLGSGQEHTKVERTQKQAFWYPTLAVYQLAVHDRDLARGSAEVDEPKFQPEARGLGETYAFSRQSVGHDHRCWWNHGRMHVSSRPVRRRPRHGSCAGGT